MDNDDQPKAGRPFAIDRAPTIEMRMGRGVRTPMIDPSIGAKGFDLHLNVVKAGDPGGPYHYHSSSENAYIVVAGEGLVRIDGKDYPVGAGDAVFIPPGVPHSMTNVGPTELRLFEIYSPPEPDFIRLDEDGS
jgi:mannose-6-phosphate isomerase-like protein (cupin superfamily)